MDTYDANYLTTKLYSFNLHRDDSGQIIGKTEVIDGSSTEYVYTYDTDDRLTGVSQNGVSTQSWNYDKNGNRTHENGALVAQYDAQDRLIGYGDNSYRYTANGELTSKTNTLTNETTTYDYDIFSNLRNVTLPDGTGIEYVIDGQNRRVGKKRNGTLEQGFLYQGQLNPVAELDGNNNVISRFVYADKGHVPAYMIKGGVNYRISSDHLGSVRLVVNSQTGEVVQRMDYDAWGNVLLDSNPGFQPFGYAGGIYDRDTQLVRFGARDYDPEIGRWTTKDPIGFDGGLNHYEYANSSPIMWTDASGNSPGNYGESIDNPMTEDFARDVLRYFFPSVNTARPLSTKERQLAHQMYKDAWEYHFLIQGVGDIPHNPIRSPKPKSLISTLLTAPGRINQEIFRCKLNLKNVDNPYDALNLMGVGMGARAAILTKYDTIVNQSFN